jgi:phosphate uptake regulator
LSKFTRRLQKIGSSILVSLPKEWVDTHNLGKSSQVQIETAENSLSITAGEGKKLSKEIEISYPLPSEENIGANVTGAYLLGYDIITIKGKSTISVKDREVIRESMRRLVGMEILDEDASNINGQFLLDETSLNPEKIFKRMSSIALGMFNETLSALRTGDKTNLQTIPNRDDEINRQYFLLVRFIRSTMVDRRLAGIFNLENIDILDYRIAGNILETAGDTIVDLSKSISETSLTRSDQKKIYDIAKDIETIQKKSINAFITNNRSLAIEAIKLHRHYQGKISKTRSSLEHKKHAPIAFLDLIYIFEKIAQSWSDISDLIQPTYRK